MASTDTVERQVEQVDVQIVDCDVHLMPKSRDEVLDHMPEPLRSRWAGRRAHASGRPTYLSLEPRAKRADSFPPSGAPPGSEPDFVYQQLFGDAGVDLALLIPEMRYTVDPEMNAALCSAFNRWLAGSWLEKWNVGGRFFGSISVSTDDPDAAVTEIETWAEHPHYKQVLISDVSERPLGYPRYEPIWEAAARHRLPVTMHFSGHTGGNLGATPAGRFQHHVDYHSIASPLTYSAHLLSLLCSGVFDRHPDLRVVFVEGGFLWHRPLLTRLAHHWDRLRVELPTLRRDPLDYVRDHIRFTTQPIEESERPQDVARLMDMAEADRLLMFSSDYPHYDFDHPRRALPRGIAKPMRQRIMSQNACELYELPGTRPALPT